MFRKFFGVPDSTPKPLLRFDLGSLSIVEKIHVKKLSFIYHLKGLEKNSLASEFYEIQAKHKFPGLITECRNLLKLYDLPNIIDEKVNFSKESWKKMINTPTGASTNPKNFDLTMNLNRNLI